LTGRVQPVWLRLRVATLARAAADLDVTRDDEVMTRWRTRACILANPLTEQEQTLLRRARAADFTGLRARDENGGWITL
jgi:hypothetical protein